jgi:hypothetical protein
MAAAAKPEPKLTFYFASSRLFRAAFFVFNPIQP